MKNIILLIFVVIFSYSCSNDDGPPPEEPTYRVTITPTCPANMNHWVHYCVTKQTHDYLYGRYGNTQNCHFIIFRTKSGEQRQGYYVMVGDDFTGVCDED